MSDLPTLGSQKAAWQGFKTKPDLPVLLTIKEHSGVAPEETRTTLNPSGEAGLALRVLRCVMLDGACVEGPCSRMMLCGNASSRRPTPGPRGPAAATAECTLSTGPRGRDFAHFQLGLRIRIAMASGPKASLWHSRPWAEHAEPQDRLGAC